MSMIRPHFFLLALLLAAAGLPHAVARAQPSPLADYAATATGRFTSLRQHQANPAYDEVEAHIVRIWADRSDGVWLYQEQAILTVPGQSRQDSLAKPYFQRVGHVTLQADGSLRRENHVLKEPLRFAGLGRPGYSGPEPTPADLGPAGCHNILETPGPGVWAGRTEDCRNTYKGAAFMRSVSVLTGDRLINWDRGFTAEGAHVWGPKAGGYVFDHIR